MRGGDLYGLNWGTESGATPHKNGGVRRIGIGASPTAEEELFTADADHFRLSGLSVGPALDVHLAAQNDLTKRDAIFHAAVSLYWATSEPPNGTIRRMTKP